MSLEQAILDRLEKRNGQIEMLQQTIQAMSRAADAEREHARQQLGPLIEENKKLAAQVDSEVTERRERLIKSLNDEITKRDHELRAHEKELAEQREEIRLIIETATYFGMTSDEGVGNFIKRKCIESEDVRDEITRAEINLELVRRECEQIRREVPLESTREGLKNAVAKLQEVTTDRDRVLNELAAIVAEANKSGRCGGDPVALIKQGHADWVAMEGMERQLEAYSSLSNARAQEIEALKGDVARERDRGNRINAEYEANIKKIMDTANKLGRTDYEAVDAFMERQALRLAALESEAGKIGYVAKGEHEEAVTAARENGIHKGESLSGFIWRQCEGLRKSQAENAPLNKLFVVLCKQRGNLNEEIIYRAVDEASEEIRQLTA